MPSTAAAEIHIELPREQAWEKLRDLSRPHLYVPNLTGCEITTAQREGVGASRRVFQKGRAPMDETVIEWQEGHGFVIRLHNGDRPPMPFKEARFVYRIDADDKGGTIFRPSMVYTLRGGVCGLLLDRLFLNRIIRGVVRKVGLNLKQYYETGQPSNPVFQASKQVRAGSG
jgi:hypothetical protein